jgi:spore coat polysaccharide biosynthesis protein SpsF
MLAVVLQARLDSNRLPRKALLPLGNSTVLQQAMLRLKQIPADYWILATDSYSAAEFQDPAEEIGFHLFTGPADDVLARYVQVIDHFSLDTVIRATGDNPLVSPALALDAIELYRENSADYAGLIGMPLGLGVEVIRAEALKQAFESNPNHYEREHVAPYLYTRPEEFSICREKAADWALYSEGRLTLDTREDYRKLQFIFKRFGPQPDIEKLIHWMRHESSTGEVYGRENSLYSFGT